jgi:hypothetical protein
MEANVIDLCDSDSEQESLKSNDDLNKESELNGGTRLESSSHHPTELARKAQTNLEVKASDQQQQQRQAHLSAPDRRAPRAPVAINNLSDEQYCCVWHVEVFEDGYRPQVARALLARVARHVNPILRARGWRVKRLLESASTKWIGCCTGNGRSDADAASANIQLNLRVRSSKYCETFRPFHQILSVMLHEITHISIGLEDIHPPAFFELMEQIKGEYRQFLQNGHVAKETDDYGCNNAYVNAGGQLTTVDEAASDIVEGYPNQELAFSSEECGSQKKRRWRRGGGGKRPRGATGSKFDRTEKRRPLLKGAKMIDARTREGKAALHERSKLTPRELAARAALARFGNSSPFVIADSELADDDAEEESCSSSDEEDTEGAVIVPHSAQCACRCCDWETSYKSSRIANGYRYDS